MIMYTSMKIDMNIVLITLHPTPPKSETLRSMLLMEENGGLCEQRKAYGSLRGL